MYDDNTDWPSLQSQILIILWGQIMENITLKWEPGGGPLYEQLYRYFVTEMESGRLREGERLPSKRALRAHLGVSQSTVETAYGLLAAEGYLRSAPRSGYFVSAAAPRARVESAPPAPAAPVPALPAPPAGPDLSTGAVDTAAFPYASWAKLHREVMYRNPDLLQKGENQGDLSLRQALCAFLREWRGVRSEPEQVLVGAGMEYLLDLLIQLIPPGDVWALEDPGYGAVRRALQNNGRRAVFVPLDGDGMRLDSLGRSGASVAYITPSHQFPMGVTMPIGRRSRLLEWAEGGDRLLIEDDYDSEFRYGPRPVPALQGLDRSGRVVYIGTFSRSVAPSIRVAYLVLPRRLLPVYRARFGWAASTVSRFEQQTLRRFLEEGLFARHLRRMNALYRRKQQALLEGLSVLPGAQVRGAQAGLHFLVTVPGRTDGELVSRAAEAGLRVRGLSDYAREAPVPAGTAVLGFAGLRQEDIPGVAARLVAAWR